jgi:hypothetical protein
VLTSESKNNKTTHKCLLQCASYGAKWGILLACVYAAIPFGVWAISPDPSNPTFLDRIIVFVVMWLYGCGVGSITGGIGGAVTGCLICVLLLRFEALVRGHAWLIGVLACLGIGGLIYILIGRLLLFEAPVLFQIFIVYPGFVYILAGGILTQRWYNRWLSHRGS